LISTKLHKEPANEFARSLYEETLIIADHNRPASREADQ
jgi:hypothetical protein